MNISLIISKILDIIFPKKCLGCELKGVVFCAKCLSCVSKTDHPVAIFNYNDPTLKKALWRLKFNGEKEIARALAPILYEKIKEESVVVIPIPLSKKRLRFRGFNQSELIGLALADYSGVTLDTGILSRVKHTKPQTSIKNREERINNVKGIFKVVKLLNKNTRYIILDDITTTGATLNEARKTLLLAGATNVKCLAVAH